MVDLVFDSRQAMFLAVGPDLVMIYNDAYITFLPGMHPGALGSPFRVLFSAISEAMEPMLARTLAGEQEIMIDRHFAVPWRPDAPDSWYTATWTAIRNEHGQIDGFIASVLETTERITAQHALRDSEDRQAFLLTLGDAMRVEASAIAKIEIAARLLGERLGASRVLYAEYDWDEGLAHIFNGWFADGAQPFPTVMQLEGYDGQVLSGLRAGRTVRVDNVGLLTDEPAFAAIAELGVQALLSPPLIIDGTLAMNLSIHQHDARHWTDSEVALVREVADRLWPEVVSARAEAALRESEERQAFLLYLSDVLRPLADPTAIKEAAARLLGERLDVGRAFYADADRGAWHVAAVYESDIEPLPDMAFAMSDFGNWIIEDFRAGRTLVVDDVASDARFAAAEREANLALGIAAVVAMPLVKDGELVAMLTVQNARARAWSTAELALVGETAERTWAAVERARAEAALRESEERQRLTVKLVPALLWSTSPDGQKISLNEGWSAYTGQSEAETQSHGWLDAIHPDDLPATRLAFEHAYATGEPLERQHRIRKAGNGWRWHLVRHVPVHDAHGRIARWVGATVDIHDRKLTEEALQETDRRLQTLVEGVPQLVWRASDPGIWAWASPQWTDHTGQTEPDSRGRGWLAAVHPDDREQARARWNSARESGRFQADYRIFHVEEQRYRWFQTRALPVRNADGTIIEWLGTSTDVDDLRRMQDRQQVLVAELQHRVRNILTIVRSVFQRTVEADGPIDAMIEHFRGRLDNLARTQVIVTQNAGGQVDLRNLIVDELMGVGVGEGPNIIIDGPDVTMDSQTGESISLAIHELTTNAVKYGALKVEGATLTVKWLTKLDYGEERRLDLTWIEQGVPAVSLKPARYGFGSELIEEAIPYRLGGESTLEFRGGGVRCTISVPLPGASAADAWEDR